MIYNSQVNIENIFTTHELINPKTNKFKKAVADSGSFFL